MAQQASASIENNFTKGLITESTGLNFPENAAFDTQNCVYEIIGDVVRREGFDFELNGTNDGTGNRTSLAISTYKWNNVGGDGSTQIIVRQVGASLYFFRSSTATTASPLSTQRLTSIVVLTNFQAAGNGNTVSASECTYADGNGYLFVYHKDCDPIYCAYTPGSLSTALVTPNKITVQIRDFLGVYPEPGNPAVTSRPTFKTIYHDYNLRNQGWTSGTLWGTSATSPPNSGGGFGGVNGYGGLSFSSNQVLLATGNQTFTVDTNINGISVGNPVTLNYAGGLTYSDSGGNHFTGYHINGAQGFVTAYTAASGSITINITSTGEGPFTVNGSGTVGIISINTETINVSVSGNLSTITTWASAIGNFPSNADVWWRFKNTGGAFSPSPSTIGNTTLPNAQAPNGSYIVNAFNQDRTALTGISIAMTASIAATTLTVTVISGGVLTLGSPITGVGVAAGTTITAFGSGTGGTGTYTVSVSQTVTSRSMSVNLSALTTTTRPTNGTWFQGRVWYTGVNASQAPVGELSNITWTEDIYFSQVIENTSEFGYCYQLNDPTDENFFDLLPTDGGVITIQGTGAIYKLFPIQNGLLVFAANGIWFITGSTGIGFAANDYTVTKISGVQSISSTSFISIMGYPFFWNEEGIYTVSPGQTGSLQVNNLCVGTILTYYNNIPLQSKKFVRGDYNPVDYIVQWVFRSTNETSVTDRYQFDTILNFNTVNKAFYPYTFTVGTNGPFIHDVRYVAGPGGSTSPSPTYKYLASNGAAVTSTFSFAEERDATNWKDWNSVSPVNYVSYFITGYKIRGQAQRRWQPGYVYLFCRNASHNSYKIQGQWEFGISGNSGKWSTVQVINDFQSTSNFGVIYHRHRIRGHGLVFQMKVQSVDGKPFDVIGWSIFETQNSSV